MKQICLELVVAVGLACSAAPTLVSKWDFDAYNGASMVEALKPTVGEQNIEIREGSGSSSAIADDIIGPAYLVDGSTAPGLSAGDYALALPKGVHLKVPFPTGLVSNQNWTVRVRFFYPTASGSKVRSILQPALDNKSQYLLGLKANNYLWVDNTQLPGSNHNDAQTCENGEYAGSNSSRTAGVNTWHTLTTCMGMTGFVTYLNGWRTVGAQNWTNTQSMFTGDGLLLFADNDGESDLVYVASVELWKDTPVYHNIYDYLQINNAIFCNNASLNDFRDGLITARLLGGWVANLYSQPLHSYERILQTDVSGNATAMNVDFVNTVNSYQNILATFMQTGANVEAHSLCMAYDISFPARYFLDSGAYANGSTRRTAGQGWNEYYSAYNLYCTPFISMLRDATWSKQMGVGQFGSPRLVLNVSAPTLTIDTAVKVTDLVIESGIGNGPATLTLAFADDKYRTMDSLAALTLEKDVTLATPAATTIGGTLTFKSGSALAPSGLEVSTAATLFSAKGGVVLPEGSTIEDFVRVDTGTVTLSDNKQDILYTPFGDEEIATATWTGRGDGTSLTDPANWSAITVKGTEVSAIPTANTTVLLTGETSLNVPAGTALVCRRLAFSGTVTCTNACDWTGLESLPVVGRAQVQIPANQTLTVGSVNSFRANCSFAGAGRLRVTAGGAFGGAFPASISALGEVEMAGDVNFANCNWVNAGKLILSGTSSFGAEGQGSTSTATPGAIVVPANAKLTLADRFNPSACRGLNFRSNYEVNGGSIEGAGYFYFSAWGGQDFNLTLNDGRVSVGFRPFTSYYVTRFNLTQTGGVFAPSTLQAVYEADAPYKGTSATYTFKGGVFEPPADMSEAQPWLPVTVPVDGDATIRVVTNATLAGAVSVAGRLTFASDDATQTLALTSLTGTGTVAVVGSPSLQFQPGTLTQPLASAADATLAFASTGTVTVAAGFTAENFAGSLALKGGEMKLVGVQEIGGELSFAEGAKMFIDTGTEILPEDTPLFTAKGGVKVPAGTKVADFAKTSTGTVILSEDGTQLLLGPDPTIPIMAYWTGNGDHTNSADPQNWRCLNVLGEEIVSVPTSATTIYLSGETSFDIPAGTMPTCRELRIAGPITLATDCDWRGLDSISRLVDGSFIDLKGHTLKLACPDGTSPTSFVVTNSTEAVGTLYLDVAEGATFTNTSIEIQGNSKLVKAGLGTFVPERKNQPYTAGTEIVAGKILATTCGTDNPMGPQWATTVTVREGATFDLGQSYHFTVYTFILDGGEFLDSLWYSNTCRFGNTRLEADSVWTIKSDILFWPGNTLNLNGHTLAITMDPATSIGFGASSIYTNFVQNGTIDTGTIGTFKVFCTTEARTADFIVRSPLNVFATFNVHDYDAICDQAVFAGTGAMNVFGRMTIHNGAFYGCVLQDGATLDLSRMSDVWSTTRTVTGTDAKGNATVTFANNANVTVDLGRRVVSFKQKVASWSTQPSNFDTLKFVAPPNANYKIYKASDGIYATMGMVLLVR